MSGFGESQHTTHVDEDRPARLAPDLYAVLGVPPDAAYDDIRRAFHAGAKQWHPDRYQTADEDERADAERHIRALIEAYAVLSDPARRAVYDSRRRDATRLQPGSVDDEPDASAHTSWYAPTDDPEAYDRLYANSDPSGVANFLGVLLGLIALGILWAISRGALGVGYYFGLAFALVIGAAALWCFADPAGLARAAERLAPSTPAPGKSRRDDAASQERQDRPREEREGSGEEETDAFERLVDEAVASIPAEFQPYLRNIVVRVRSQPSAAERRLMRLRQDETLFGLYEGVMLTNQGAAGVAPEVITIFQRPIEQACGADPERTREQVRRTVLHELAHHFGMDHDAMPDWLK